MDIEDRNDAMDVDAVQRPAKRFKVCTLRSNCRYALTWDVGLQHQSHKQALKQVHITPAFAREQLEYDIAVCVFQCRVLCMY